MTASELSVAYDPYAPELRQDPYPVYSWLREQAPLYRHPEKGFFALSRFADILEAIHDWETFSSAHGVTLEGVMTDVQPEMITMDPPPPLFAAGTVNLYSRDFFALCRDRLQPGGVLCVWIQPEAGGFSGGSDPRADGGALGF